MLKRLECDGGHRNMRERNSRKRLGDRHRSGWWCVRRSTGGLAHLPGLAHSLQPSFCFECGVTLFWGHLSHRVTHERVQDPMSGRVEIDLLAVVPHEVVRGFSWLQSCFGGAGNRERLVCPLSEHFLIEAFVLGHYLRWPVGQDLRGCGWQRCQSAGFRFGSRSHFRQGRHRFHFRYVIPRWHVPARGRRSRSANCCSCRRGRFGQGCGAHYDR